MTTKIIIDTAGNSGTVANAVPLDWPTTRNAASGNALTTAAVGGAGGPGNNRAYFIFDTSSIPPGAKISAARLKLYITFMINSTGSDLTARVLSGQPTYPHIPIVLSDYDRSQYSGSGGDRSYRNDTAGNYINHDLNAAGIAMINKGGITKLNLQNLEYDINDVSYGNGAANVYVLFGSTSGQEPQLEVTYSRRLPVFRKAYQEKPYMRKVYG